MRTNPKIEHRPDSVLKPKLSQYRAPLYILRRMRMESSSSVEQEGFIRPVQMSKKAAKMVRPGATGDGLRIVLNKAIQPAMDAIVDGTRVLARPFSVRPFNPSTSSHVQPPPQRSIIHWFHKPIP